MDSKAIGNILVWYLPCCILGHRSLVISYSPVYTSKVFSVLFAIALHWELRLLGLLTVIPWSFSELLLSIYIINIWPEFLVPNFVSSCIKMSFLLLAQLTVQSRLCNPQHYLPFYHCLCYPHILIAMHFIYTWKYFGSLMKMLNNSGPETDA